jgi:Protein of unknown function (DUF4236)
VGYLRLFRRIKIAPGVTINVSKSGLSTSFGPKGAKVTVGKRGVRRTVGIPGTGVYYTSTSSGRTAGGTQTPAPGVAGPVGTASRSGRRSWIVILVGVVIVAAIAGSWLGGKTADTSPTPPQGAAGLFGQASSPTRSETSTAPTNATASPQATPTPTPATRPPATLTVKVTSRTASVTRNSIASVSIKTAVRAACSIVVEYTSGPSKATGLGDKTASSTGGITWSWKVGSNTTRGTWPIHISCDLGDRSGSIDTSFTVR